MRPSLIVAVHVGVENGLHFVDGLEPSASALDAEVLVGATDKTHGPEASASPINGIMRPVRQAGGCIAPGRRSAR
jgi:hypothetical protein